MRPYLRDLIARMNDDLKSPHDKQREGTGSNPWDEAHGLADGALVDELSAYVEVEKDKRKRDLAYRLLACLARNLGSPDPLHVIAARLAHETKSRSVVGSMLDSIACAEVPYTEHVENVLWLAADESDSVRHDAIRALRYARANLAEVDRRLKSTLESESDPYLLLDACYSLRADSAPEVIAPLLALIDARKEGVIPELVDALAYLQRYQAEDERIPALFRWVVDKKRDFLQKPERAWVEANLLR